MKTKILFTSLIIYIISVSSNFAQNLIQNGGFESLNTTIQPLNGVNPFYNQNVNNWYSSQGSPQVWSRNIYPYPNASPHSGDGVAFMGSEFFTNPGSFSPYYIEGIFQNISFNSCNLYKVSFWIRNPSTSNFTLTDYYIKAVNGLINNPVFENIAINVTDFSEIYHGVNLAPGAWTYVTTTFMPQKNFSQIWIYPRNTTITPAGTNWAEFTIDDISVENISMNIALNNDPNATVICNSGNYTFTVQNFPSNVSYSSITWQASSNLSPSSGTGSSFTVHAINSSVQGSGTVTATIQFPQCSKTITKNIWIGKPQLPQITGPATASCGLINPFIVSALPQGNTILWTANGFQILNGATNTKCNAKAISGPVGTMYCQVSNVCGSNENYLMVNITCMSYTVSPNPAKSEITISLSDENAKHMDVSELKNKFIKKIKIFDKSGNVQKIKDFGDKSSNATINISDLQPGYYILEINKEEGNESHQLIKE
jgi:hypothetical protein